MAIRPLSDYLIVKPISEEMVTKSGIVLPDTMDKEKAEQGEIVHTGPGKRLDNGQVVAPEVKIGDKVMFKKYAPDEIKIDGVEYLVIRESDVMLIIE